jgi:YD repeat-containing protein
MTTYLTANSKLRFGTWSGAGFSAGRESPPFDPILAADLNVSGVDAFDQQLSRPHDIAYDQAQQTLASQWDVQPSSRANLLVNYFSALESADTTFLGRAPTTPSDYLWGEMIRAISLVAFAVHIAEAESIKARLGSDAQYAAFMAGLSKQQMKERVGSLLDVAGDAVLYWVGLLGDVGAAVTAAITSLNELLLAVDNGDDIIDLLTNAFGAPQGSTVANTLNQFINLLEGRQSAIHQLDWVSVAANDAQANGDSSAPAISSDGRYVAFQSWSSDLVANDTNGAADIFVHDRQTDTTTRVSVGPGGAQSNGGSVDPSISGDGRFVAFVSGATNLAQGDSGGWNEIFVHDRTLGTTRRLTVGIGNQEPDWPSDHPSIVSTSQGTYSVAFASAAGNLVAGDERSWDVFVYQSSNQSITKISKGLGGAQANDSSDNPSIATNGMVAFDSYASNLVANDTNAKRDVFIWNGSTNARISLGLGGAPANEESSLPSISADGNFVAFQSYASNLVTGDTNGTWDIFVYNRTTGVTERVSLAWNGVQADGSSYNASISGDGRFVTFFSSASNLIPTQVSPLGQTYVYDRETDQIRLASASAVGETSNAWDVVRPVISADGTSVAFDSIATNLYSGARGRNVFETDVRSAFNSGGPLDDVIRSALGNDVLDGGRGNNTVSFAGIAGNLIVTLALTGAQNTGGAGTDTLTNFRNIIGGDGADRLSGDGNGNALTGALGADQLNGAPGLDVLTGGLGRDKFIFDTAALTDARATTPLFDQVKDYDQGNGAFSAAEGDQIDLSAIVATAYNRGAGQAVAALVRVVEAPGGTFSNLQVDPDGSANGASWTTIARLDGIRAGNTVSIILDAALPAGSTVTTTTSSDLDVLDTMTLSSPAVLSGGSTTVKYTLANGGAGAAAASKVGLYRSSNTTFDGSDTLLTERSFGQVNAQAQVNDSFALTLTTLGTYYIIAVADHANQVLETGESDNPSNAVQVTVSDQETIHNSDGSTTVHRVDALNQQPYRDYFINYDALGRATSQTTNNDDGSRIVYAWDVQNQADWADYNLSYDAQNRITGQVTHNDNQSYIVFKWDVASQADWSDYRVTYDSLNRPLSQVTNNDNGSRIVFQWDVANQAEWTDYRVTYDSQNRPISQVTNNDNGSRIVFQWDVANQFNWSDYRVTTDAQGRAVSQVTNNDNGTHLTYGWDVQNQASWSDYVVTTDSQNRATTQTTHYDNGNYAVAKWDVLNQFNWASMTDTYNAQGQHLSQQGVYDNGTTWMT